MINEINMLKINKITTAIRIAIMFGAGSAMPASAPVFSAAMSEYKNASLESINAIETLKPLVDTIHSGDTPGYFLGYHSFDNEMILDSKDNWEASIGGSWVRHSTTRLRELSAIRSIAFNHEKRTAPYGLARF
mgnify:CR=1 FL=1